MFAWMSKQDFFSINFTSHILTRNILYTLQVLVCTFQQGMKSHTIIERSRILLWVLCINILQLICACKDLMVYNYDYILALKHTHILVIVNICILSNCINDMRLNWNFKILFFVKKWELFHLHSSAFISRLLFPEATIRKLLFSASSSSFFSDGQLLCIPSLGGGRR